MKVRFIENGHKYQSIPKIDWTSVTTYIHRFCPHFDSEAQALRCSENETSKWFGLTVDNILELWAAENKRSTDVGSWFHNMMERRALAVPGKEYRGQYLKIIAPIMKPGYKLAPDQELTDGIYPEHFIYNEKLGICGQSDLVYCYNNTIDIDDYKTNKELKLRGYGWEYDNPKMMLGLMSHIEDCNFFHYALQLSLYMKLILLKNPGKKAGRLRIYHVTFQNEGYDDYGFPILKRTENGEYIPNPGKWYEVPYLEKEVNQILGLK